LLQLETDQVYLTVDPDNGATIRHLGPDSSTNLLASYPWEAPLPDVDSVPYGDGQLDWLSRYRGGWHELFPNAGAACEIQGVPLPFHGEVSTAKWQASVIDERSAVMRCAARLPLVLERRIELHKERPSARLIERVTNKGTEATPFLWGHHPAFDVPAGTLIDLPKDAQFDVAEGIPVELSVVEPGSRGQWPTGRTPGGDVIDLDRVPQGPVRRLCYLTGGIAWFALRPPTGVGIAMSWDPAIFPRTWFWQEIGGPGFPWFGRANITAIEPATSGLADGLAEALARGEAHTIGPGEEVETALTVVLLPPGSGRVADVGADGSIRLEQE
jgi:hypothetical protein